MNWWKIGFFVALLAFEGAREIAVVASDGPPNFALSQASAYRSPDGGFVKAEGRWQRTDGGEAMVPAVISIECWRERGSCVMATTTAHDGYVFMPDIRQRDAVFTETGAEFTDDWPECQKLFVRIDAVHKVTTAIRSSKPSEDPMCKGGEAQIQMRLGGFDAKERRAWQNKHFVPLLRILRSVVGLFE